MTTRHFFTWLTCALLPAAFTLTTPSRVFAHCDGLDGPVVKAAQKALDARNPALVLIWVQEKDEPEIRAAFNQALSVRALGPQAKALADRFFFETVVRVHRAGEGAPYTGLKPAGRDLGPAIPAADKALATGSLEPLAKLFVDAMQKQLRERFDEAVASAAFAPGDLSAGRESIRAYVEFIHYVERLYDAAAMPPHGHFTETAEKH
jgi:hypothetical protein